MYKSLSLIVSVYNEEDALRTFYKTIKIYLENLKIDYEIIFINDGSIDSSEDILRDLAKFDKKVKCIILSKNFGHEAAMLAGIDMAKKDILICMDADLQHPPNLIKSIVDKFYEGYDIVNMIRVKNKSAGIVKNICSSLFYSIINILSKEKFEKNASDFFAISSKVAMILRKEYREKVRFLRAYIQNIGFKSCTLSYEASERVAGHSKYSLLKLLRFSTNAMICFTDFPLKLAIYAGGLSILVGIIMTIYTILNWARFGAPSGYTTIITLICFMFAILFFILGIMGKYISIIFAELKDRPIYLISEILNENE